MSLGWIRWWFRAAAVYGIVALLASLATQLRGTPTLDGIAFALTALAFQLVFWIVGGNPVRYRPLMLAGVAEKLAFGVPVLVMAGTASAPMSVLPFGIIDLVLGAGFLIAWWRTPPEGRLGD